MEPLAKTILSFYVKEFLNTWSLSERSKRQPVLSIHKDKTPTLTTLHPNI